MHVPVSLFEEVFKEVFEELLEELLEELSVIMSDDADAVVRSTTSYSVRLRLEDGWKLAKIFLCSSRSMPSNKFMYDESPGER